MTCERINRKCEETADDERMEGEEEEKARETSRSGVTDMSGEDVRRALAQGPARELALRAR